MNQILANGVDGGTRRHDDAKTPARRRLNLRPRRYEGTVAPGAVITSRVHRSRSEHSSWPRRDREQRGNPDDDITTDKLELPA